ncbi:MAG: hypothetical protein SCARUB_02794 [Candidatus Scalindua rubra]|uniref:Uncharacterized protein n=1 Tax=Candidatus Scalindua rubra TaxID=1872076 RepID=A0A1E3X8X1_9BACT|nr:MAG: hypothetical protein SCARUB_02794 [Candidatus Scalindua rubra]
MVIGADSGMANRINNHILAIGCTKDIKALNQLLENIEKTIEVLSQGIFRICNPGKVFHPEDEEFDIIPFEGRKHWAWDIAFGKDAVLKVPARSRVSWGFEFLVGADPNKMEIESNEECLLFCYQSLDTDPEFNHLSKMFPDVNFKIYVDGELQSGGTYITYGFKDGVEYRKWDDPVFSANN